MTEEQKLRKQKIARIKLVASASLAKDNGFSMLEWMEAPDVLNLCKDAGLDVSLLEHIVQWVWNH
jgi:hypothetical protein